MNPTAISGTGLLTDKVVLILGASSGIGADAAQVFCEEGATVMLGARSTDRLTALSDRLEQQGHRVAHQTCDITNAADVQAIVDATVDRYGRIDAAFNNAGISQGGHRLIDLTEEQYDEVMATNLRGIWLALRHRSAPCSKATAPARSSTPAASAASVAHAVWAPTPPPSAGSSGSR
jgi:NAD(P)-dependent dehydrogenase (short-subunit alcohol dehydrogenase family)